MYKAIDAFCGAGGLALGLEEAGFETVAAFDIDPDAVNTFNTNLSPVAFEADATTLGGGQLLQSAKVAVGELDLLAGGPPCQGFSKQKRGAHLGDDRNGLVVEFARLVKETRPKFFLLENVDQLGQKRGREFVDAVQLVLTDYLMYPGFYNSANFGLAQTRKRFVLVGKREDIAARYHPPKPTTKTWRTVGEVLNGLPEPPWDYTDHPDYPNHQRARVTEANIKRFAYVPQGGGWPDIPFDERLACHQKVDIKRGGWPEVYGRLRSDGQAPTITGGFDSFTRGRYGHPDHDRPLTPREAARLQGFPDDFIFTGTRYEIRSQIGNAVPPPLAKAFGETIGKSIDAHATGAPIENDGGLELAKLLQIPLPLLLPEERDEVLV